MKFRKFSGKYLLRLDQGDEIIDSITRLAKQENIKLASVSGIGAVGKATIGFYEVKTKTYHKKEITGEYEMAPLAGNITTMDGETYVHLHATLGAKDTVAGHLNIGIISATAEIIIDVIDGEVNRVKDDLTGLNLIELK